MNEKIKLGSGVIAMSAFAVLLSYNLIHPLSHSTPTDTLTVGTGSPLTDILAILYCGFMAFMAASTPHTIRQLGSGLVFTSFIKTRTIAVSDIESIEKARFGFGANFRHHRGSIGVNASAVNFQLIRDVTLANPKIRIVGL